MMKIFFHKKVILKQTCIYISDLLNITFLIKINKRQVTNRKEMFIFIYNIN